MGEPVRRVSHKAVRREAGYAEDEPYAADVLLIADAAEYQRRDGPSSADGEEAAEPLNVENVVRKLIALLSEQP
jgi:hypothetical protein